MAWNEPGGGGKDPWGGGNNQGGPPDLDEVIRNVQSKVTQLFGNKGRGNNGSSGGSGSGGGGKIGAIGGGLIFIVVIIGWIASGIYIIQPAERGVVTQFGKYQSTSLPGPHWRLPWPIQTHEAVNVDQNRSVRMRNQSMLTRDENIVVIEMSVQYNVKNAEDFLFQVRDPDSTLQQVAESAVREVIGKNDMDFIITQGRNTIAEETLVIMQQFLDEYRTGILVNTVNFESAQPPEAVQAAFDDATKAREDEQRFINEAEAYANEIIPRARGTARQVLEEAKAYRTRVVKAAEGETNRFVALLSEYEKAPQVTRDRLYLDAVEQVLNNTNKVVIDVEGGNNLMYLPLDKLINQRQSGSSNSIDSDSSFALPTPSTPSGTLNRRSRESN
ncbi:MAG: FtsH protease activity modulator HflK [Pseudomonadota bacterium]